MVSFSNALLAILVIATVSVVPGLTARAGAIGKQTYTIVPGDSLSTIASAHGKGIDWRKLYDANPSVKHPDLIFAGSTLAIPSPQDKFAPRAIPAPVAVTTTPAPAPAPAPAQSVTPAPQTSPTGLAGCELARSLINQYDWNKDVAYSVMMAESSCDPQATNMNDNHGACVGSFGLFQINCTKGRLYDPAQNVLAAYNMYKARGSWADWGFTTCAVKVVCN